MKRFKVISLHPFTDCNLNCSFCYKKRSKIHKPKVYWISLIPYLKELTGQIALGGGEPTMHPVFIREFSDQCNKHGLIFNITSNGKLLKDMTNQELKWLLKGVTMLSLSFDKEKVKNKEDLKDYYILVKRIKKYTKTQVGCNLLVSKEMFEQEGIIFILIVKFLFETVKVDRVYALSPKNAYSIDILKYKHLYQYLTIKNKKFYIDDLTKEIIEQGYIDWKKPCHFGKDLVSIDEQGYVTGCSFDPDNKAVLEIKEPKDILKVKDIKFEERFSCPYLVK